MIRTHRLLGCLLLVAAAWPVIAADRFPYQSRETLELYLGKVETLRFGHVERVAIGNEDLVATSLLSTDELLIIPKAQGQTDLVIWQTGNRKRLLHLSIRPGNPEQILRDARLRLLLYPQLDFRIEAATVLVSGEVATQAQLDDIVQRLTPDLIHQVRLQIRIGTADLVRQALSGIDGLEVKDNDGWVQLSGSYAPEHQTVIEQVLTRYPGVLNTAQVDAARLKVMVLVDVQIMEVRRRELEKLGIRWDSSMPGPAAALSATAAANPYFRAWSGDGAGQRIAESIPVASQATHSAVGLATQITSQIELMQESGIARMLARPMLSTRDGTPSSFHSGGALPYPVIDARTGNIAVEFHEYGVRLTVLPRVSHQQDLLVEVEAEVSSVDNAISINGVPGLVSKSVRSVVNTRPGETIVMSGLLSAEEDDTRARVPLLGDLPLLGALFRARHEESNHRELAIFLTPHLRTTPDASDPLRDLGERTRQETQALAWPTGVIQE